jgi:hypothetical protein
LSPAHGMEPSLVMLTNAPSVCSTRSAAIPGGGIRLELIVAPLKAKLYTSARVSFCSDAMAPTQLIPPEVVTPGN